MAVIFLFGEMGFVGIVGRIAIHPMNNSFYGQNDNF